MGWFCCSVRVLREVQLWRDGLGALSGHLFGHDEEGGGAQIVRLCRSRIFERVFREMEPLAFLLQCDGLNGPGGSLGGGQGEGDTLLEGQALELPQQHCFEWFLGNVAESEVVESLPNLARRVSDVETSTRDLRL